MKTYYQIEGSRIVHTVVYEGPIIGVAPTCHYFARSTNSTVLKHTSGRKPSGLSWCDQCARMEKARHRAARMAAKAAMAK